MNSYKCVHIYVDFQLKDQVEFGSTDTELVKWAVEEMREIVPKCKVLEHATQSLLDETHFYVEIIDLKKDRCAVGRGIAIRLAQTLMQQGWEPIDFTIGSSVSFRLRKAEKAGS